MSLTMLVALVCLTTDRPTQIYEARPAANEDGCSVCGQSESARSTEVAERFGISAKTVRDIWNRLTWIDATQTLWNDKVPLRCPFLF